MDTPEQILRKAADAVKAASGTAALKIVQDAIAQLETIEAKLEASLQLNPPQPEGIPLPALPDLPNAYADYKGAVGKVRTLMDLQGNLVVSTGNSICFDIDSGAVRHARVQGSPTQGQLFQTSGKGGVIEDVDVADGAFEVFINRGTTFEFRRVRARTFGRYLCYSEGGTGTLEDLWVEDAGADQLPNTADDDGGSTGESILRLTGQGTYVVRRCRFIYRGKKIKACIRGDGKLLCEDCYFDGGQAAWASLLGADGARTFGLETWWNAKGLRFSKDVRKPMVAAQPPTVAAAIEMAKSLGVDADFNRTYAERAKLLAERSTVTFRNCYFNRGIGIQAGTDYVFDNCTLRDDVNFLPLQKMESEWFYPEGPNDARNLIPGRRDKIGWQLPFDVPMPKPTVKFIATDLGKTIGLHMNYDEQFAKTIVSGTFVANGKAFNW